MSDAYAFQRFSDAVQAFRALEDALRSGAGSVDGRKIDAVLIDLQAAIPGLDGEDLGRALVFKAYATHWRYLTELDKKNIFEVIEEGVDPRLKVALADAKQGEQLLTDVGDRAWAASTIQQLEEYMRG